MFRCIFRRLASTVRKSSIAPRGRQREEGSVTLGGGGVSDQLDMIGAIPSKNTSKLQRGLEKAEEKDSSLAQQGLQDAQAEDICGIINDTLASNACAKLFRGYKDASMAVEVEYVVINKDCSHATAFWRSDTIDKFCSLFVQQEGMQKAMLLRGRMQKQINDRLEQKEALFRSFLIKKMDFRRVPRILFLSTDADKRR